MRRGGFRCKHSSARVYYSKRSLLQEQLYIFFTFSNCKYLYSNVLSQCLCIAFRKVPRELPVRTARGGEVEVGRAELERFALGSYLSSQPFLPLSGPPAASLPPPISLQDPTAANTLV